MLRIIQNVSFDLTETYDAAAFAYDPLDCLNDIAEVDSCINVGLATKLCSAAWTRELVECYVKAGTRRELNRGLSTTL